MVILSASRQAHCPRLSALYPEFLVKFKFCGVWLNLLSVNVFPRKKKFRWFNKTWKRDSNWCINSRHENWMVNQSRIAGKFSLKNLRGKKLEMMDHFQNTSSRLSFQNSRSIYHPNMAIFCTFCPITFADCPSRLLDMRRWFVFCAYRTCSFLQ